LNMVRGGMDLGGSSKTALYDSWTPDRKNASAPMRDNTSNFSNSNNITSYPLEDGSYLRNKSLMLGYTFPNSLLNKMKLERLRVYVQVVNLFTITNYKGLDPELYKTGVDPKATGVTNSAFGADNGNYPNNQRQFLVGVNLGL
jgi:hypothetical protein